MRKMLFVLIAVMLLLPAAIFAGDGLSIGGTAMYFTNMTFAQLEALEEPLEFQSDNDVYGLATRVDLSMIQADATAFFVDGLTYGTMNAGLFLDLGIVGLGASGGVWYVTDFSDAEIFDYNVKVNADIMLGSAILSAYAMGTPLVDIEQVDGPEDLDAILGVSALFQL